MRNVSLAVYEQKGGAVEPLSVQIFDESRVFIMHAAERPSGEPRDISIEDRITVLLLDDYYENIWKASTLLVDAGIISAERLRTLARPKPPADS